MNEYYTNNDVNDSYNNSYYENKDQPHDYYSNQDGITEADLVNKNIVSKITKPRLIVHIFGLLIPLFFYLMFYRFIQAFKEEGRIIVWFLVGIFLFFLFFFIVNVGKKIEVLDRSIIITKCFVSSTVISINNITKCEVITGLTSHGRYYTEHYNKIVLHYTYEGANKKVDITDNLYTGWNEIVRYMDYYGKCEFRDGRNWLSRLFDKD